MDTVTIDRFEGDMAVAVGNGGGTMDIPRSQLPQGAREGTTLVRHGSDWAIDGAETSARADRIAEKLKGRFK